MQDTASHYEHIPYAVGRQYVMDWRKPEDIAKPEKNEVSETAEAADKPEPVGVEEISEIIEVTEHSPKTYTYNDYVRSAPVRSPNSRLLLCIAAAVAGVVGGAVIAAAYPIEGAELAETVADTTGGFWGILLNRVFQSGAFLIAAYLLGFFAAGGFLSWIIPLVCGLGTGLSAAGLFMSDGRLWLLLPLAVCCVVVVAASYASGEFSSLIMRLVSSKGEVISSGSSAERYTLRFGVYLMIVLAMAIAEAAIKLS